MLTFLVFSITPGTQKKKLKKMEQELEYLDQMMEEMETRYGYRAEELEYGPGFYVPYFQSDEEVDVRRFWMRLADC